MLSQHVALCYHKIVPSVMKIPEINCTRCLFFFSSRPVRHITFRLAGSAGSPRCSYRGTSQSAVSLPGLPSFLSVASTLDSVNNASSAESKERSGKGSESRREKEWEGKILLSKYLKRKYAPVMNTKLSMSEKKL